MHDHTKQLTKDRWHVPPCFVITKDGEYKHIEHQVPITVRNTVNTRGSDYVRTIE